MSQHHYNNISSNQHNENSDELLRNLVIFLAASENLVRNLRDIIESKMQSSANPAVPAICTCPGDSCELVKKRTDFPISGTATKVTFDDTLQRSSPSMDPSRDVNFDSNDNFLRSFQDAPVTSTQIDQSVEMLTPPPDTTDATKFDTTLEESKNISEAEDQEKESVDTVINEPVYEDVKETKSTSDTSKIKSCECVAPKGVKSQCMVKAAKSKTKQTASRTKSKRQLAEKFTQEKTEKFAKLKETITCAQKYLSDIQEQIRQLERLFQDYDSTATPEGQVNPARLYREIMKPQTVPYVPPQTVPYVSFARSPMMSSSMNSVMSSGMTPLMNSTMISPKGSAMGIPMNHVSMQTSQGCCCPCPSRKNLGRISVLSAVACEDDNIFF